MSDRLLKGAASALFPVFLLALSLSISGCGIFESKKIDYKAAKRTQPLDIPPELTAPGKDERYTVSEMGTKGSTFSSYLAERSASKAEAGGAGDVAALLPGYDKLRIERAGMQRWLVAPAAPEQVWPLVHRFLTERGVSLKLVSPETGIMETEWADKSIDVPQGAVRTMFARALGTLYSTSNRDRYRIRLEPGLQKNTTDIFVTHHGAEEVYINEGKDQTRWQPRPSDPDLETEMLRRLMAFLGMEQARASTLLTEADAPGRARLAVHDRQPVLEFDERFDRAWRRVGLVLDRNGFTVDDRDRAQGIYFVRYNDPLADKKKGGKGFWSSLAFWRSDNDQPAAEEKMRVAVSRVSETSSRVQLFDKDGGERPASDGTVQRILDLLLAELR